MNSSGGDRYDGVSVVSLAMSTMVKWRSLLHCSLICYIVLHERLDSNRFGN